MRHPPAARAPARSPRRLTAAILVAAAAATLAAAHETTAPPGPTYAVTARMLDDARADLARLDVKGRAPLTGYDRDAFGPAWADVDGNGCDTRDDVLARDLDDVETDPATQGCVVLAGTLSDPYGGGLVEFRRGPGTSAAVQVDHVVALGDAWQKGAQGWDDATRLAFANDPANLLASDGPLNQRKGAGDAATWLPPSRGFRCAYVLRQVQVKAAYGLWVTQAEHDAIARELDGCVVRG
ncbi:uncharacterized protein DUF1524 [Sediminihabitans luteus]|uniref:Uncharacterized protein DUF1524 n=1 Tax=Sediminihabitans luteus TaxID=1138585 RepID=A0A2M9CDB7_9CELL|nr:HNH endonuclease family protein [Sediminihabitans luteus]PJJ69291.1 uncharacterized protein DUF1524 [Sediminihabitans luteus]GII98973.1 hypothetical protein Slu03_13510 [Sediminihabitans luteus]